MSLSPCYLLTFPKDKIAADANINSEGCFLASFLLASDKTTVSVATGHNEYYPLYILLGNVDNTVRRSHRGAVAVLAFLAIIQRIYYFVMLRRSRMY